ncbi:DNA alkylation repair protein [Citricoccus sp. NPDC079358]|uniref:DNA alkylation repair protein n=1 Tax=Citricoccus sp. NPDC079358 TaxID=3154653 RepID=UPI00344F12CC
MPSADELLGARAATALTRSIRRVVPGTDLHSLPRAAESLDGLALRERADLLREALLVDLPGDYQSLAHVIRQARDSSSDFSGWLIWPVTGAVAARAVQENTAAAFTDAMALLAELTGRLTSEFSLRTLLRHDLDRGLAIIAVWTDSADEHIRRLASEGTRPYLPWAVRIPAITAHPGVTVPLLEALYRDPSEYVRRSVANHLNDLSRDAPDLVVSTAQRWLADPGPQTPALVRHGLRTLLKNGHPGALDLLGFGPVSVDIDGPHLTEARVPWGGEVRFTAVVRNVGPEPARLAIDYVIHHRKANSTLSTKVFKLTTRTLQPGEEMAVNRSHSFRAITTRRYHPGGHAVALQVNGISTLPVPFELLPADQALSLS